MITGADVGIIKALSSSNSVGADSTLTLKFFTPVPLFSGDKLYITIPDDVVPPTPVSLKCSSLPGSNMVADLSCSINNQVVTISTQTIGSL